MTTETKAQLPDHVFERLKATERERHLAARREGRAWGRRWAMDEAAVADLEEVEQRAETDGLVNGYRIREAVEAADGFIERRLLEDFARDGHWCEGSSSASGRSWPRTANGPNGRPTS